MKNREFQTLIAGVLLAALMAGSLAPASLYAKEGEKEAAIQYDSAGSGQTVSSQTQEDAGTEKAVPVKEETVYAKVDGQGAVKSVIVSDQLRNVSGKTEIEDMSDLTDIENVKGDETFTADGKMITWNGSGEDIVYQGTTEKSLPVGVEVPTSWMEKVSARKNWRERAVILSYIILIRIHPVRIPENMFLF